MKRIFLTILLLGVMSVPALSYANLTGFRINAVIAWDEAEDECAVEGEITSIDGGQISGDEKLTIDGITWGDFSELFLDASTGYNVGDTISFGTLELSLKLSYQFDVELNTFDCQDLVAGQELGFQGSFGDEITTVDLAEPMLNYGLAFDSSIAGNYTSFDLTINSWELMGLFDSVIIGEGPLLDVDGDDGGVSLGDGCTLVPVVAAGSALPAVLLMGFGLAVLGSRRRS